MNVSIPIPIVLFLFTLFISLFIVYIKLVKQTKQLKIKNKYRVQYINKLNKINKTLPQLIIKRIPIDGKTTKKMAEKEARIQIIFDKLGISPKVYDYFECGNTAYIVMEKYNMTLADYLYINPEKLSLVNLIAVFDDIIKNVKEKLIVAHSRNFIHGDIHPNNIMVKLNSTNTITDIKLVDYGHSTKVTDNPVDYIQSNTLPFYKIGVDLIKDLYSKAVNKEKFIHKLDKVIEYLLTFKKNTPDESILLLGVPESEWVLLEDILTGFVIIDENVVLQGKNVLVNILNRLKHTKDVIHINNVEKNYKLIKNILLNIIDEFYSGKDINYEELKVISDTTKKNKEYFGLIRECGSKIVRPENINPIYSEKRCDWEIVGGKIGEGEYGQTFNVKCT